MTLIWIWLIVLTLFMLGMKSVISAMRKAGGGGVQKETSLETTLENIEWFEDMVEKGFKNSHLKESLSEEKYFFETMKGNYVRLKVRYKHDPEKMKEVALDWVDYLDAIRDIVMGRERLDVDWESGAGDRFRENVEEPHINRQEIEKRFKKLLGGGFC